MSSRVRKKHGGVMRTIAYMLGAPVYLVTRLIPRNKRLWVFGSGHGWDLVGNSKYLFLYTSRHLKEIQSVFLSRNPEVVMLLQEAGYDARATHSVRGIWALLRSGRRFTSHSTHDLQALLVSPRGTTQLWHGTPLKKIAYDAEPQSASFRNRAKSAIRRLIMKIFPYLNTTMRFDRIVIASGHLAACYRSAFRISDANIAILGQPHNDCLDESYRFDDRVFPECDYLEQLRPRGETVITWMPTHRLLSGGSTTEIFAASAEQKHRLEQLLAAQNARLIIKIHPLDGTGLALLADEVNGAELYNYPDPYPLLRKTDVLITDYSSAYFDFLLLDEPILFAPFDIEDYRRRDAGFYFDYDEVTPGPKCTHWEALLDSLEETLQRLRNGDADPWQEKRQEVCSRFNEFRPGNCERIARYFLP